MPRPKLFDRTAALDRAIAAFRSRGFAATSTDDLLAAMDISRQSMYDTFGDKRRLYLEALERYNADSIARSIRVLRRSGIEAMLLDFAKHAVGDAQCLGLSSTSEFGRTDRDVCALNDASGRALIAAVEEVTGDKAVARFVVALIAGIKLSARAGASFAELKTIIAVGMRSIGP